MMPRVLLAATLVALAACNPGGEGGTPTFAKGVAEVTRPDNSRTILEVEIANTPALQSHGLMDREHLDENQGMLFQFAEEGQHVFWMKNTRIPLDMLFLKKGKVVGLIPWARPMDETPLDVGVPSDGVLEVNGGWASRTGTSLGSTVQLKQP